MVFDVDGVLIDTSGSYTVAVIESVQWLLAQDARVADDGAAIGREDVRAWREAGGWNNDWDLTLGLYRWLLSVDGRTTQSLRRAAEPASVAARRPLAELGARAGGRAPRTWEEVRSLFDEFYNGSAVSAARHGLPARAGIARGRCEAETILLRAELIAELRARGIVKFGVVTGRSDDDWAQVASRLPLPADTVVSTDSHGKKPDPLPLKRVLDALGAKGFVAVGDTVDDVQMVTAYLPQKGAASGVPIVRCEPTHEAVFRAAGAAHFVRSIDELPALLEDVRGGLT